MTSSAPVVALVFGNDWMEVDASLAERRGGLRAFAREAEIKWGLQQGTFGFVGSSGKVDSVSSLQRELSAASSGVCKIDVQEQPEAKMRREMHAAVKASEDRMMAKLEASICGVRQDLQYVDNKVSALAPMMQCIGALAPIVRSVDTKVAALAPMVQCMALEQVGLRGLTPMVQCMAMEQIDLRNKITAGPNMGDGCAMPETSVDVAKSLEDVEKELLLDCAVQAACDLHQSAQDDLERLRLEVSSLEPARKQPAQAPNVPCSQTQCEIPAQKIKRTEGNGYPKAADAFFSGPQPPTVAFAYSNKTVAPPPSLPFDAKWRQRDSWSNFQGSDGSVAFPQSVMAPPLSSAYRACWGSRSMPILPPIQ